MAAFSPEWWPASHRNPWPASIEIRNQFKIDYELIGNTTPPDVIEETANAIDMAQIALFDTRAPSLDAVCEKIYMYFGVTLTDPDNPDSMALFQVMSDLRWLERNLLCSEV